jgi:adenine-specific DNA-methyltransferase
MDFAELRDNWVIQGDNLKALQALQERSKGRFAMAYLDPPYNTGTRKADAYEDRMGSQAWRGFMAERLDALWPLMAGDGVVMIQIDDHELGNLLGLLAEQERSILSHVVVKMSELSGVKMSHAAHRLPKLKEHLLMVAVGADSALRNVRVPKEPNKLAAYCRYYSQVLMNPGAPVAQWRLEPVRQVAVREWGWDAQSQGAQEALVALKIQHAPALVYRTNNAFIARDEGSGIRRLTSPDGVEYIAWDDKQMLFLEDHLDEPLGDLWTDLSTINLNKEGGVTFRHSKKPEKLIQRCLELGSQPGDWVLDPFAGSGTTAAVASTMGRRFVTMEQGNHARTLVCTRLDALDCAYRFMG